MLSVLLIPLLLIPIPVFAQMESIRITGNLYPEIDSAFNVKIIVQGTSRSSTGYFDVQATIYEKNNPNWLVAAFPKSIYSGTNTALIDMKQGEKPFKVNVPYILQIQHALIITTFEFTPIEKSSNAPIVKNPYQEIEDIIAENKELKEELEKKDAVIMEQVRVIQNLASMLKKTVFEPIMNYFSMF